MTDRATVFQKPQIGRESPAGTRVSPSRMLSSMEIALAFDPTVQTFAPAGFLLNTVAATNYEQTRAQLRGVGDYRELVYLAEMILGHVSPTTPASGSLTRDWEWLLNSSSPNDQAVWTALVGDDATRAALASYLLAQEVTLTASLDNGLQYTGAGVARKIEDDKTRHITITGGTPTSGTWSLTIGAQTASSLSRTITAAALQTALEALSNVEVGDIVCVGGPLGTAPLMLHFLPGGQYGDAAAMPAISAADTFDAGDIGITRLNPAATQLTPQPVVGAQISHYLASSYAGLTGATALTRLFNWQFKLGNRANVIKPMRRANNGTFDAHVETRPDATVTFSIGADDTGMAYLRSLRANSLVFYRQEAIGAAIETVAGPITYYRTFIVDACLLLTKVTPKNDSEGLVQVDFEGVIAHDPTWGRGLRWFLRNELTAL